MVRKHLIIILLLLCTYILTAIEPIWSQGYYEPFYDFGILSEDECVLQINANDSSNEIFYKYSWNTMYSVPLIQLDKNLPIEINQDFVYKGNCDIKMSNTILALIGYERINKTKRTLSILYSDNFTYGLFALYFRNYEQTSRIYKDCTSYLIEKTKSYPVENLNKIAADTPWVENAPGYGIGESFVIENSWGKVYTTLLIMNGYISYEKPYLYKQNGRVKQIKVTGVKSRKSKILDVLDTPHPQTVDISFITEAEDIKVEIADVYEGTKYEDTCIHYMITYNNEVIPYENKIGE